MLDIDGIMEALPHRYPFLLLDRVIEWDRGKRLVAIKNVTMNEPFFQGHFPGNPVMPGVLILEAMAQAAAIMMKNDDVGDVVPLFMGIDKARFRRQVVPGDQLRLEVETLQARRNVCKGAGKAFVGDELAAEAELMAMLVPRDQM
ncbi:MAG: 3-hydroxyacyl-ACP dehydratase FabZ [Candidatus Latescibacteria bacterium]|nr:3-hydroxyacyl-ACP dehydratase FabZ [Candidatus Latescibacterota bacterium]MBT4139308.1 3-hydroxyacyl-ACP dehydratase FabZ [Candidatus Latescibacterota bacterium]MBT5832461.1 3-hydroxyacyl-ACP dehydratase FabZ [Candidatus Latescibacterota bacterium]